MLSMRNLFRVKSSLVTVEQFTACVPTKWNTKARIDDVAPAGRDSVSSGATVNDCVSAVLQLPAASACFTENILAPEAMLLKLIGELQVSKLEPRLQAKVLPAEPVNVKDLDGLVPDGVGDVIVGLEGATVSISIDQVLLELSFPAESSCTAANDQVPSTNPTIWQVAVSLVIVSVQTMEVSPDLLAVKRTVPEPAKPVTEK
jgi:hypothetical protein